MKLSTSLTSLLLLSVSLPGLSQEITDGSTLTPQQTRSELQTQMQSMSAEDRELYRQLNGSSHNDGQKYGQGHGKGRGDGSHQRKRDGSGKGGANRQRSEYRQRSDFGSGYGSGYGSRQGGFGRR
jgi:hypothetical protein